MKSIKLNSNYQLIKGQMVQANSKEKNKSLSEDDFAMFRNFLLGEEAGSEINDKTPVKQGGATKKWTAEDYKQLETFIQNAETEKTVLTEISTLEAKNFNSINLNSTLSSLQYSKQSLQINNNKGQSSNSIKLKINTNLIPQYDKAIANANLLLAQYEKYKNEPDLPSFLQYPAIFDQSTLILNNLQEANANEQKKTEENLGLFSPEQRDNLMSLKESFNKLQNSEGSTLIMTDAAGSGKSHIADIINKAAKENQFTPISINHHMSKKKVEELLNQGEAKKYVIMADEWANLDDSVREQITQFQKANTAIVVQISATHSAKYLNNKSTEPNTNSQLFVNKKEAIKGRIKATEELVKKNDTLKTNDGFELAKEEWKAGKNIQIIAPDGDAQSIIYEMVKDIEEGNERYCFVVPKYDEGKNEILYDIYKNSGIDTDIKKEALDKYYHEQKSTTQPMKFAMIYTGNHCVGSDCGIMSGSNVSTHVYLGDKCSYSDLYQFICRNREIKGDVSKFTGKIYTSSGNISDLEIMLTAGQKEHDDKLSGQGNVQNADYQQTRVTSEKIQSDVNMKSFNTNNASTNTSTEIKNPHSETKDIRETYAQEQTLNNTQVNNTNAKKSTLKNISQYKAVANFTKSDVIKATCQASVDFTGVKDEKDLKNKIESIHNTLVAENNKNGPNNQPLTQDDLQTFQDLITTIAEKEPPYKNINLSEAMSKWNDKDLKQALQDLQDVKPLLKNNDIDNEMLKMRHIAAAFQQEAQKQGLCYAGTNNGMLAARAVIVYQTLDNSNNKNYGKVNIIEKEDKDNKSQTDDVQIRNVRKVTNQQYVNYPNNNRLIDVY